MVPLLKAQYLLSDGKFAEAGYISVCDPNKVNLYDGRTAKIVVSKEASSVAPLHQRPMTPPAPPTQGRWAILLSKQRSAPLKFLLSLTATPPPPPTWPSNHQAKREPTRTVNMVPSLKAQSLLSGGKFAEAGYISVCDHDIDHEL